MKTQINETISKARIQKLHLLLKRINIDQYHPEYEKVSNSHGLRILNEALTHTSAETSINYERLEFLGDAVLRLAASEFIESTFPNMKVGDRSELRAQLVSDSWLSKVGREIEIHETLIIGNKAAGDSYARATLEAEATEALIGALYECFKGIEHIISWLKPHWEKASTNVLSDPHKNNYKSALQEWSQGKGLNRPEYHVEECSQRHGDPFRFFCRVHLEGEKLGEGRGSSRRNAEKEAAKEALKKLTKS